MLSSPTFRCHLHTHSHFLLSITVGFFFPNRRTACIQPKGASRTIQSPPRTCARHFKPPSTPNPDPLQPVLFGISHLHLEDEHTRATLYPYRVCDRLNGFPCEPLARRPGSINCQERCETDPLPHCRHRPFDQERASLVNPPVTG